MIISYVFHCYSNGMPKLLVAYNSSYTYSNIIIKYNKCRFLAECYFRIRYFMRNVTLEYVTLAKCNDN